MTQQRVAVVGGGAMGGAFGASLARAGHDVVILDVAQPLVDAITAVGVTVERPDESFTARPRATTSPTEVGGVDVVLVFVKAHHTAAAAVSIGSLMTPETVVASLQNGWGNADVLAEAVPSDRLVVGVTYHSATLVEPGRVKHSGQGQTVVGPYAGDDLAAATRVGEVLRDGGFETVVTGDVRTEIWRKLVLNAATLPTAALSLSRAGELAESREILDVVDGLAAEAVAVARAQGMAIELDERLERIHATLERAGMGKPSMLQDVEARRKTEVERINGAVVAAADASGVPAPLNRTMLALVHGLERSWARTA